MGAPWPTTLSALRGKLDGALEKQGADAGLRSRILDEVLELQTPEDLAAMQDKDDGWITTAAMHLIQCAATGTPHKT